MKVERKDKVVINLQKTHDGYKVKDNSTVFVLNKNVLQPQALAPQLPTPISKETIYPIEERNPNKKFKQALKSVKPIAIPSSAVWFDIENIHRIEKESLPEFFSNSNTKNPDVYIRMRNTILALFYSQSDKYLTATACLKVMVR